MWLQMGNTPRLLFTALAGGGVSAVETLHAERAADPCRAESTKSERGVEMRSLEHDPKKWTPVLGKDHAQTNNLEHDDDSKKNHFALELSPISAKVLR
jgi:hypothetical protein